MIGDTAAHDTGTQDRSTIDRPVRLFFPLFGFFTDKLIADEQANQIFGRGCLSQMNKIARLDLLRLFASQLGSILHSFHGGDGRRIVASGLGADKHFGTLEREQSLNIVVAQWRLFLTAARFVRQFAGGGPTQNPQRARH